MPTAQRSYFLQERLLAAADELEAIRIRKANSAESGFPLSEQAERGRRLSESGRNTDCKNAQDKRDGGVCLVVKRNQDTILNIVFII